MSEGYSRRTVLRGVAGGASALALPAGPATDPGAGPDPAAVADGVPGAGRAALSDHDRAAFLAAQDPVWARMPRTWYEGPFLGNGFLGSILYAEPAANGLRFTVQHSEVQDHRPQIQGNDWGVARLPVGHLTLEPVGQITGVQLRLHLWDAEVRGTITTDKGHIRLRALVQNDCSLLLVTARPSRGERDFRCVFPSEKALSPRIVREPPPRAARRRSWRPPARGWNLRRGRACGGTSTCSWSTGSSTAPTTWSWTRSPARSSTTSRSSSTGCGRSTALTPPGCAAARTSTATTTGSSRCPTSPAPPPRSATCPGRCTTC